MNDWDRKAAEIEKAGMMVAAAIYTGTQADTADTIYASSTRLAMALGELGRIAEHCRGYAESDRQHERPGGEPA
jgi:hypothetical protein